MYDFFYELRIGESADVLVSENSIGSDSTIGWHAGWRIVKHRFSKSILFILQVFKASLLLEMLTWVRKNSHMTVQKIEGVVVGFPLTQQKQIKLPPPKAVVCYISPERYPGFHKPT